MEESTAAVLIEEEAGLSAAVKAILKEPILAVDTESNSLFAYREQVCLVQFSTPDEDYLVDPLALSDISALEQVFSNSKIEKVFHAAEYDLICLYRDFGFRVENLFDTMIAARILGRQEIGLGGMLNNEFDIHLEKKFQRANWGRRPLSREMLEYARLDTHYLIQLRSRLTKELLERDLMTLAREDFVRMAESGSSNAGPLASTERPVDIWRISGSYDLSPQQARVLYEACIYRDAAAQKLDQPLFKVLSDKTLLAIAQQGPQQLDELSRLTGMSRIQIQRHGRALLQAVQRGNKSSGMRPVRNKRPDPAYSDRLERLRQWRKKAGEKMGVPSDVILPRDLLQRLTSENPRCQTDLERVMVDVPWRMAHFGNEILRVLRKD